MSINLLTLVKDESDSLRRMLASALPHVDSALIVDTGSTDDTREIARAHGCEVAERPWVDFAHNRTEALHLGRETGCDYLLMLDADHTLHTDGDRPNLDADSYLIRIHGRLEWWLPLLTRAAHPFEYRGAAHAYLASGESTRTEKTDWLSIDGGSGATVAKLTRDREVLERAHATNPADTRTVFYLAQTYRDLGMIDEAITTYRKRVDMGGWDEEVYYARFQLGALLSGHVSFAQGASELLEAWYRRPNRAEALRALANAANAVADKLDQPDDVLFVTPDAYRKQAA